MDAFRLPDDDFRIATLCARLLLSTREGLEVASELCGVTLDELRAMDKRLGLWLEHPSPHFPGNFESEGFN